MSDIFSSRIFPQRGTYLYNQFYAQGLILDVPIVLVALIVEMIGVIMFASARGTQKMLMARQAGVNPAVGAGLVIGLALIVAAIGFLLYSFLRYIQAIFALAGCIELRPAEMNAFSVAALKNRARQVLEALADRAGPDSLQILQAKRQVFHRYGLV